MSSQINQLSQVARRGVQSGNWPEVNACARQILAIDKRNAEGFFLLGLSQRVARQTADATRSFEHALKSDKRRYDAGIELAGQYVTIGRHTDAKGLLDKYRQDLANSPLYLDMAASLYSRLGLHEEAWPLYNQANKLQPGIDMFEANLAACAVLLGRTDLAKEIYRSVIEKNPDHQRNHYELSRIERARDDGHIIEMMGILERSKLPPGRNVYLYYALGKELEDLGRWDEAFDYYEKGGNAAMSLAGNYDVASDIALIDTAIGTCSGEWLASAQSSKKSKQATPIFVTGLPRSGTTLVERIISSHSRVESVDETFFMQLALGRASGESAPVSMSPSIMQAAASANPDKVAGEYLDAVTYKLTGQPFFVEKLPENFLYLGFIARSFPDAPIVLLRRNPMDSCFALYKQSFFKYAYTLENVGRYYVAFDRLRRHFQDLLGDRIIDLEYESLVESQEQETRTLLDKLGLAFEQGCLEFEQNESPTATASSTQVRERIHTRSVGNWRHFEAQLAPLKKILEDAGIDPG